MKEFFNITLILILFYLTWGWGIGWLLENKTNNYTLQRVGDFLMMTAGYILMTIAILVIIVVPIILLVITLL